MNHEQWAKPLILNNLKPCNIHDNHFSVIFLRIPVTNSCVMNIQSYDSRNYVYICKRLVIFVLHRTVQVSLSAGFLLV